MFTNSSILIIVLQLDSVLLEGLDECGMEKLDFVRVIFRQNINLQVCGVDAVQIVQLFYLTWLHMTVSIFCELVISDMFNGPQHYLVNWAVILLLDKLQRCGIEILFLLLLTGLAAAHIKLIINII